MKHHFREPVSTVCHGHADDMAQGYGGQNSFFHRFSRFHGIEASLEGVGGGNNTHFHFLLGFISTNGCSDDEKFVL